MEKLQTARASGHGFGTAPVFLAGISTILGAILFLRFGYAVGNIGLLGVLGIILLGHLITIPTGLALAEIATNLKVKGGGEYYIISRSFGLSIGGAIGIALCMSQIISTAFYMIAFAEAFTPLFPLIEQYVPFRMDVRMISLPASVLLFVFMLTKGANLGVKLLWVVAGILAVSLLMFFLGENPGNPDNQISLTKKIADGDNFFIVFAICFPGFTGMTAGVGLSGDLKNPARSIPLGTMAATLVGMLVYTAAVFKLHLNAAPEDLANNQLIMSDIALWGPIIPIGLACATLSSAIGSFMIAPRTLQALGKDSVLPSTRLNRSFEKGKGTANEPVNASIVAAAIALIFIALGDVDFVAQIISMFFMTTYGALCAISFLEHFSGNPSYRPVFRSKWYLSLLGAVLCVWSMFKMQPFYAILAIVLLYAMYYVIRKTHPEHRDLSTIFKNVMFQTTRKMRLSIQRNNNSLSRVNWRPSIIAISSQTHQRLECFNFLRWVAHYYGFGTFYHYLNGLLDSQSAQKASQTKEKLLQLVENSNSSVFVSTVISPSFTSALAQIIQIPGVSGLDNNTLLLEFNRSSPEELKNIAIGCRMAESVGFNTLILRSCQYNFGYRQQIDVWLTSASSHKNSSLMILLSYIIKGHPEWKAAQIKIYAAFQKEQKEKQMKRLNTMISEGRIPISSQNIVPLEYSEQGFEGLIAEKSDDADLVIVGFEYAEFEEKGENLFQQYQSIRDIVFVSAKEHIRIY